MAELLSSSDADIQKAGERLRAGRLCAFATETVYGLGANALDGKASKRIFEVKGRPPTDPLICHVAEYNKALPMWNMPEGEMKCVEALRSLWPGPLTVVGKASSIVPDAVHGGSGFVGVRIPNHAVAIKLLQAADVPVCAPSANLFGHVSPTQASHVMDDLALRDDTLTVVDGGSCTVGIESTVVKIVSADTVEILRKGFLGVDEISRALENAGIKGAKVLVRDTRSKATAKKIQVAQDGPGQLLTHYSPSIPAYLVTPDSLKLTSGGKTWKIVIGGLDSPGGTNDGEDDGERPAPTNAGLTLDIPCDKVVIIDYGTYLGHCKEKAAAYRSLTASGDALEACSAAFDCLRWSETIEGADAVIFPMATEFAQLLRKKEGGGDTAAEKVERELMEAVEDRLFRAASGTVALVLPAEVEEKKSEG